MNYKERFPKLICPIVPVLLLAAALMPTCGLAAAASADADVVRVGYFDLADYYQISADGTVDSYDTAYLNMISEYTGLTFEYVDCGTWDRALQLIRAHEIDLVGTMQWTQDRENTYEICDASYGYTVAELAALSSSDFIYEDYSQMDGSTVGCIEGYVIYDHLQDLMQEHHISLQIQTYPNQQALSDALESGAIDLLAANSHAVSEDWKVIEKFSYAPYYFASWKGNRQLTEAISDAIIHINIHQDNFDDMLTKAYFPRMVSSPYNKAEMDCMAEENTYSVYLDAKAKPLSWYDEASGTMKGILVDLFRQLAQKTGLTFHVLPLLNQAENPSALAISYYLYQKEFDTVANKAAGQTKAIFDENFLLYRKSGQDYSNDAEAHYRVAVSKGRGGCIDYLSETFPNYELITYDTPADCITHLNAGDVDLAFLSSYVAEECLISNDISGIYSLPTSAVRFGIALQFNGVQSQTLADIINKGRNLIGTDELQSAILDNVLYTSPNMTLTYFIRHNLLAFTLILLTIFFCLALMIGLLLYTRMIKQKNQQIMAADQSRTDFFSRMSHDLRTPMNGILGMIELTKQAESLDEVARNMAKAKTSGDYMLSLINDTLDLQRLENRRLQFHPQLVQVREFMDSVLDMIRPATVQKHITLTLHTVGINVDRYITIDPIRVKQIFMNILSNAVKFTPEGGTISIQLEQLWQDGTITHIKISIRDTGIGMSREFIALHLYKPYSQEKNAVTGQYAGSGLGLAITKNLVTLMGGKIEVESELGVGTQFILYLDFSYVDQEQATQNQQLQQNRQSHIQKTLAGAHLLICEDHPLNAEISKRLLGRVGCTAEIAVNGQLGLACFAASEVGTFDAVLMDIRMPVMDGLRTAEAIRSLDRPDAKTVPIIAMTANAYDEDIEKSKKAGMNAHLAKPIEPTVLYETLVEALEANRQEQ